MQKLFVLSMLLLVAGLWGCASSRVVLLDDDKTDSAILVITEKGSLILDQPNTFTELSSTQAKPSAVKKLPLQELQARYGQLLAFAPKPPINFLLYFGPDSTTITAASKTLFPAIVKAISERVPCDVNIIGHADRTGSKAYNIDLSLKRARWVAGWLQAQQLQIANIIVESYGEEDPLIPTQDGVPEPRNRRVEVLIR